MDIRPIGVVRSPLKSCNEAPKQGIEGAPDAWIDIVQDLAEGLDGIAAGDELIILTWLHQGQRDVLKVHPRDDFSRPLTGVFATRSADRPNPIGLHRVRVHERTATSLRVGPIEAIDGTPVADIKPAIKNLDG